MQVLRLGSEGEDVRRWQRFLAGQGLLASGADGVFGPITERASKAFQRRARLGADGVVGPMTYAAALQRGLDIGFTDPLGGEDGLAWPPRPSFPPLVSNADRARVFGAFAFEPVGPDTDDVRILGGSPRTASRSIRSGPSSRRGPRWASTT
jgi:peptidoglycan hydrolase-like protein with peptidoglycan-binding domain